jgi:AcrR family transcriptional regulator
MKCFTKIENRKIKMKENEKSAPFQSDLKKKEALRLSNAESKALTRECIRTALLMLLGEKCYEDITTTEIIKKSGVSRAGFYRNYHSKLDVIQDIHDTHSNAVIDALKAVQEGAAPEPVFKKLFEWLQSDEDEFKLLMNIHQRLPIRPNFGLIKNVEDTDPEAYYVQVAANTMLVTIIRSWFVRGMREPPEAMAKISADIYIRLQKH